MADGRELARASRDRAWPTRERGHDPRLGNVLAIATSEKVSSPASKTYFSCSGVGPLGLRAPEREIAVDVFGLLHGEEPLDRGAEGRIVDALTATPAVRDTIATSSACAAASIIGRARIGP